MERNYLKFLISLFLILCSLPSYGTDIKTRLENSKFWLKTTNDCHIYNPHPELYVSVVWTGACSNGYAEGNGKVSWFIDGNHQSTVEGIFHEGILMVMELSLFQVEIEAKVNLGIVNLTGM